MMRKRALATVEEELPVEAVLVDEDPEPGDRPVLTEEDVLDLTLGADSWSLAGAAAAERFRAAVVQLVDDPSLRDTDVRAAGALLDLAQAGNTALLRELLTPHPAADDLTWSVACYELGSVTPTSVQEFADPVGACALLKGCGDQTHAAAEMIVASPGRDVQWAALARTLHRMRFQPPSDETCRPARPDGGPVDLEEVLALWHERVAEWRQEITDGVAPGSQAAARQEARGDDAAGAAPGEAQLMSSAVRSALAESLPFIEEGVAAALISTEMLTRTIADGVAARLREDVLRGEAELRRELQTALGALNLLGRRGTDDLATTARRAVERAISLLPGEGPREGPGA